MSAVGSQQDAPPRWSRASIVGLIAMGLLVGFSVLVILWKNDVQLTVTSHQWERSIDIERFAPASGSAWCDAMPHDAYRISRTHEVRSYDQVADGQDCRTVRTDNGDGTFSESENCTTKYRDEPVFDDRCHYTVNRWMVARTEVARGASLLDARSWPDIRVARAGVCIGCEREGTRRERYVVHLERTDKKTATCDFNEAKWAGFALGSRWQTTLRVITGSIDCDELLALPSTSGTP
jgi:hypothetical protein